jgi:hypothetical protein
MTERFFYLDENGPWEREFPSQVRIPADKPAAPTVTAPSVCWMGKRSAWTGDQILDALCGPMGRVV